MRGEEKREGRRYVQQTDSKNGQHAKFTPGWNSESADAVKREEENREVGDYVNGRCGNESSLEIDAATFEGGVPDTSTRHALEDGREEVGEIEDEVCPDEDVDKIVGFTCAGGVEEATVHEEDGEFGEKYRRAVY